MEDNTRDRQEIVAEVEGSWLWYGGPGDWARIIDVEETAQRASDGEPLARIATEPIDSDILPDSVTVYADELYRLQPELKYLILKPSDIGPTHTMLRKMWHIIKAAARAPVRQTTY